MDINCIIEMSEITVDRSFKSVIITSGNSPSEPFIAWM